MSPKLYVLVRADLSKSQQAVQAGHAVAELCLNGCLKEWENGALVYLKVRNEEMLREWMKKLDAPKAFYEPDRNNEMTAIAWVGYGGPVETLPLL